MGLSRPAGSPKTPGSGRKAGTPNKRQAADLLAAKAAVAEARAGGAKLGKEICSEFANIFCRLALDVRPVTEHELEMGMKPNPREDIRSSNNYLKFCWAGSRR
jgi:hypothetical protein